MLVSNMLFFNNLKEDEYMKKKELVWEKVKYYLHRYFIVALNGMAIGLFASLIIGTIFQTLAKIPYLDFLNPIAQSLGANSPVYGAAIGAGIALGLKHKPIVVVSSLAAASIAIGQGGGPLGAYLAGLVAAEIGGLVFGKTKLDIILVPLCSILSGGIVAILTGQPIGIAMNWLGTLIEEATTAQPFLMGIIIAVVVGMALTAPISSAAICISIGINGIAAGAAAVGCCAQMIGFAICSIKKNGLSGLLSVGVGTSMLQFTNIIRKPIIWLPTIITSAILGPISTCLFQMTNTSVGAGMGTCGFVGQFGAVEAMTSNGLDSFTIFWQVGLMHFILPAILVFGINLMFEKLNLITSDDYLLNREKF